MSRVSSKSGLSPSISRSTSNGIDLGKGNNVDMGGKSAPSVTSGGIGVSREVANIGWVSVSGGVSVDISPVDFGIGYDSTENSVSIAAGAEIPGGLLGASGGVTIDLDTGEITGGSVGVEGLGIGVNISGSKDGSVGVEVTIQIPFTPIELSLGLGFPPKKKEDPKTPPSSDLPTSKDVGYPKNSLPTFNPNCYYILVVLLLGNEAIYSNCKGYSSGDGAFGYSFEQVIPTDGYSAIITGVKYNEFYHDWQPVVEVKKVLGSVFTRQSGWIYVVKGSLIASESPNGGSGVEKGKDVTRLGAWAGTTVSGPGTTDFKKAIQQTMDFYNNGRNDYTSYSIYPIEYCPNEPPKELPNNNDNNGSGSSSPFPNPPPNPPPRKQNMNECCRESIKLSRLIARHLGAVSGNQEFLPDGVKAVGSTQDGIRQAYPFVVRKRWIDPNAKENEGIPILNDRQLALVIGGMIERLERVLGTAEFYKDSDRKLRQSEGNMLSWLTGKNNDFKYPDPNDFWLNTDDGIVNEKLLEVRSIADGLRYQVEALNRLERILPIAELKNSSIPARWIHPGGKGQLQVGNLIHLCEYMIRKDDRDRGYWPQKIVIKKANPAIKGDKEISMDFQSQGDLLRYLTQQIVDTEGDVDMGSNYDLRRTYLDIMSFQLQVKNNRYLQALTEFMNFDMTESVDKVSIPFDFFAGQNKTEIEKFWNKYGFGDGDEVKFPTNNSEAEIERLSEGVLQNSEIEISVVEFGSPDTEKKEPKTLKEMLLEILKHSSAAAAAVSERVTEGGLERAVEAAGLARKLENFLMQKNIRESFGIGDLDNWVSAAEKGYTDNPESESLRFPESDASQPYGRPASQNPTIREIDTKNPKAD